MPVTGATTRNDYVASAGQTVFAYTFQTLLASDLKVIKNGTTLTLSNDYTVSGVGVAGGGNVTLTSGATGDDTVSILLAMPIDRTTEYQEAGDFLASDVNGDFDKAYVAMNQLQTAIERALHIQDQDSTASMVLPLKADRAGKYLKFNSSGIPTTVTGTLYSSADLVSIKSFGAVGDGVTDDTAALTAALNSGDNLYVPEGVFYIPGWSTITMTTPLKMQGTGTIKGDNKQHTFVKILSDLHITGITFDNLEFVCSNVNADSGSVGRFFMDGVTIQNCGAGISLERPVSAFAVTGCYFKNTSVNKPIRIGRNNYSQQDTWENMVVSGNTFENTSTTGSNDCNVILLYGRRATIIGNVFDGATAVGADQYFSGTGSQTAFTLTQNNLKTTEVTVYIDGVEQENTDETTLWTISGTTLTFTTAPASGSNNVKVVWFGEAAAVYTKCRYATVIGNSISGVTSGNVNLVYGINVKGKGRGDTSAPQGYNVTVMGNTLLGTGIGSGIRIQNDFVNVCGNNIEYFRFGVNGNTNLHKNNNISNNNIFRATQYGIHVIQSATNYVIDGNNIEGFVEGGEYFPIAGIKVRAFGTTTNYNICNNNMKTCKKGIKLDANRDSAYNGQIQGVQIANNNFDDVDSNGIEFEYCDTITIRDNLYHGEVANNYIRAIEPNKNVTIQDKRVKNLDTSGSSAVQIWNTSIVDQAVKLTATVLGKRADDAEQAVYKITALFKVDSGTLAQVGATVTEYAIESDSAWVGATFSTFNNDITLRVQGESGSIDWSYETEYTSITSATF